MMFRGSLFNTMSSLVLLFSRATIARVPRTGSRMLSGSREIGIGTGRRGIGSGIERRIGVNAIMPTINNLTSPMANLYLSKSFSSTTPSSDSPDSIEGSPTLSPTSMSIADAPVVPHNKEKTKTKRAKNTKKSAAILITPSDGKAGIEKSEIWSYRGMTKEEVKQKIVDLNQELKANKAFLLSTRSKMLEGASEAINTMETNLVLEIADCTKELLDLGNALDNSTLSSKSKVSGIVNL